ncbi:MAG: chorismate synthase [Deltaproteobacteria bacterium]|nr:chorismate synthase [Deltaproteobacteria bacterium]
MRYLTAGESHGKLLTAILDGVPAGFILSKADIDRELSRRQGGYGRGGRQAIEKDRVDITSGVRFGRTLGSPIAMQIPNLDWENWKVEMTAEPSAPSAEVTRPRPGHADLAGALKYLTRDIRDILERSSARETAARVAVGAVAKRLLTEFGIRVFSWVVEIGGVRYSPGAGREPRRLFELAEGSPLRCPDGKTTDRMKKKIDRVKAAGDSIGGVFEVVATGVPPGLGSHTQWDMKLDGTLARSLMSIQAIKAVEIGMGMGVSSTPGSRVHDEIFYGDGGEDGGPYWPVKKRFYRKTNNSGGIEGGMTNGEPIVLRAAMKPIPTLYRPLRSVDILTKKPFKAAVERSDVCAVPAASVVAEAVVSFEVARAFLEKFGGDSIREIKGNYAGYLGELKKF